MNRRSRQLARRSQRTCAACGQVLDWSEFQFVAMPVCTACLSSCGDDRDHDECRRRVCAILADRVRLGRALGNGKAVEYPDGIDLRLRDLLDDLRRYLIAVRIEIQVDDGVVVRDGHLRRVDGGSETRWDWPVPLNLGLFTDPDDAEPRHVFCQSDYNRIIRVSVTDRLLLGRAGQRFVWQAEGAKLAKWDAQQVARQRRERWLAIALLIHICLVLLVVSVVFLPFFNAVREGVVLRAWCFGFVWWLASVCVGSTLGAWERFPNIRCLFRADQH